MSFLDWNVFYTPNHWVNEGTMMDHAHTILLSYVQAQRKVLKLPDNQPATAIFDHFNVQLTHTFQDLLTAKHIIV